MAVRITQTAVWLTVGIIFLAAVVLGGLYLVKGRGEQARRADAIEVAQQNLEAQSQTGTTPSVDGAVENSGTPSDESAVGSAGDEATGATNDATSTGDAQGAAGTQGTNPSELPQTGAGDAMAIVAVALLSFAGVSYITSLRNLSKFTK